MRVKLEWLNELVDISDLSVEQLTKIISLYSTEVESVEAIALGSNLVVGHVVECLIHPDSDHLHICKVDIGEEILQIICGAPNIAFDQKVIVAKIGCVLPNNFIIKKAKIRGVESSGMICSLAELGVEKKYIPEEYQSGIFYFKDDVKVGADALSALRFSDFVLELSITPNRGDLMSMMGVAIEVAAVLNRPLKPLSFAVPISENDVSLSVELASDGCVGYYAQAFKNVVIKPSPWWLISRLIAFGVRPINNVVDITNYILALFGQPLHAFDFQKLGNKIVVRKARDGEIITSLDDIDRTLMNSDLVITNGKKPVAIAGVMGGKETQITDETTQIVIEAAVFDPMMVRKTSQRLGLRSESSARFERGVDINRAKLALDYTSYLLGRLADATPMSQASFSGLSQIKDIKININEKDVNQLLGITLTKEDIKQIFERLGFFTTLNQEIEVLVPNRRSDIRIKNDLIEEVGRLSGYTNLPNTLPKSSIASALTQKQVRRRQLRRILVDLGLTEAVTYSLVDEQYNNLFQQNHNELSKPLKLINPLVSEKSILRKSTLLGLIEVVKYNYARKTKDIALFEIGKGYGFKEEAKEEEMLSIAMANHYYGNSWNQANKVDFYTIKGILEMIARQLNVALRFQPMEQANKEMHPKRSADVYFNQEKIGFVGCLHPQFAFQEGLDEVYVCELRIDSLLESIPPLHVYQPITKYPSMERDLAFVLSRDVQAQDVVDTIKQIDRNLISDVFIFDVYQGENVQENQKSLAIRVVFSSVEPLSEEMIQPKMKRIIKALYETYQAVLRS